MLPKIYIEQCFNKLLALLPLLQTMKMNNTLKYIENHG